MNHQDTLKRTPLYDVHRERGGRMVSFAGYEMPVQFPDGIIAEHQHTRAHAGLFDVSHMGQVVLRGDGAAAALETLVPGDIAGLAPGRMRYTQFTREDGGILDDLIVTNAGAHLFVVVNGACKAKDIAHLRTHLAGAVEIDVLEDRALMALQGPAAERTLAELAPDCADLAFMSAATLAVAGVSCFVSRSGYTGEDGFEISVPAQDAEQIARLLLEQPGVAPVGLGARDSLRLEAGLCLYGHDIDETTTPVEAGLVWSIGKRRRQDGGFPGADVVQRQLREGAPRRRVGILPDGRVPAREQTQIADRDGAVIGAVTSGGFGPTVGGPVAMGYVASAHAEPGTALALLVRGDPRPARVAPLPLVKANYKRG